MNRGFSIIEILIAMAIGIIAISGVVAGSGGFGATLAGNQSTIMNGQTNFEAVAKAQQLLEQMQALGRQDFNLMNPTATTSIDGFYYKSVDVVTQPDFLTKLVTTTISWLSDHNATSTTRFSTLVTNLENVNSPNTCNSVLSGDWTNPQTLSTTQADPLSKGGNDADILGGRVYFIGDSLSVSTDDLYIYDVANPSAPFKLGSINTGPGLKAVAVAITGGTIYAYVANESNAVSTGQLQIVSAGNPAALSYTNYSLTAAGVVTGSGNQAQGNALFYKDGYIYLGLTKTETGPEFNIIDVHIPSSPMYKGGLSIGHDVNSIYVKGNYAYVASPDNEEMKVINVSNPTSPVQVSGANLPDNSANGKSLGIVGDTLYLGRTIGSGSAKELNMISISNSATNPLPSPFGTRDIDGSVNALSVRGNYIFLATGETNKEFQIWDASNPVAMTLVASLPSPNNDDGTGMDCEGNLMYMTVYNKQGLLIIGPGT